jgi:hypothetical protein
MLCNWSTKANIIIRRSIKFVQNTDTKAPALKISPSGLWRIDSQAHLNTTSYNSLESTPRTLGSPALPHLRPNASPPAAVAPPAPVTTPPALVADNLTSAQVSRASAAAIRISVARGDIWDGFHVWHSLRWSLHQYHKPGPNSVSRPSFQSPITAFEPIDFGRSVSTRLSGHCLFHALLRAGETKTAAMLAEQMMANGEELHLLSFNILLRQLNPSAIPHSPRTVCGGLRNLIPRNNMSLGPMVLELQNVLPSDPLTQLAVRLLSSAREHRWQRTTGMYESVLRACLIQGEILVASLLLVLLFKDYQLRRACSCVAAEADRVGAPDTIAYIHSKIPEAPSRGFKTLPYNCSHSLFKTFTEFLKKHCTEVDDPLFSEASQALGNLASALDARMIPYPNLSALIKILYSYPQCQHTIWITLPSGDQQSRNAYHYFHEVLQKLLWSLPDQRPLDPNTSLPALNLESYNALLNYALRHRHSLAHADRVLHHMTEFRRPQLAPNIDTYNILLRGSTLMRRNDIAEKVLQIVRSWIPCNELDIFLLHFPPRTFPGRSSRIRSRTAKSQFRRYRQRFHILLEEIHKNELNIPRPKELLELDNTFLTSYMAHLVATGRPDAVAIVITRVLPEFEPLQKGAMLEEGNAKWQKSVDRGVTLGPHFFAVALNALHKAGLRKFAERFWTLARAAEARSSAGSDAVPWCLSVHAYTAMLQLYANEIRRWNVGNMATRTRWSGHPRRPRNPKRALLGLRRGMKVFRALLLATDRVRGAAVRASNKGREWKRAPAPPKPDARFYNAALNLVSRQPGMCPRSSRSGPSRWRSLLAKARQRFLLTGQKPRGWTPELEEIAKSLGNSGYMLPIGIRLRLVGRDEQVSSQDRRDIGTRPYSFGRFVPARFAPHRIPTMKRKGLPLRGRWRARDG